jgi:CRISPR-associated exonuclease Cas4
MSRSNTQSRSISNITPTLLNYYHLCPRKCWLHAHGIHMEQESDTVYEGKLISETTYTGRSRKYTELDLGIAKIDFYDPENKVVHEVKKSNKMEAAHEWQVKYYLWLLEQQGVEGPTAILEYPKLKKTEEVYLTEPDRAYLEETLANIEQLLEQEECPPLQKKSICKKCSFHDFCWSGEDEGQEA